MTELLQVRLPQEEKLKFDRLCADNAINKSELIRQWIRMFLVGGEHDGK
jgi:metal-responsive CopG/Arc/MetJ family transcriptional regulator